MKFFTTDLDGVTLMDPSAGERREILESVLKEPDSEYPEVFLHLEGGPVIGYRSGGTLTWEEDGEVSRTLRNIDLQAAIRAWELAATGRLEELDSWNWESIS